MDSIVLDTNTLIDNPDIILDHSKKYLIPYIVLSELDGLKKNEALSSAVREAIKIVYQEMQLGNVVLTDLPTELKTNDEKIVDTAARHNATLLSSDIGALAIATARGVKVDTHLGETLDTSYTGVQWVDADYTLSASLIQVREMQVEEAEEKFGVTIPVNSYVAFPHHSDLTKFGLWKRTRDDKVVAVKQSMKPYSLAGINLIPNDPWQMAVLDAVADPSVPLTIIDGKVGSGKSLLSMCAALSKTRGLGQRTNVCFDRVFVTRPPIPAENQLKLGYRPGTTEEKMSSWLQGFTSNLKFLFENTQADRESEQAKKIFDLYFEPIALEDIQGVNIHNGILLVDEYTLTSVNVLKQILSRISVGSKVILIGDPAQTYGANRGREGYKRLLPLVKDNPLISYVRMDKVYRSELTEFIEANF